MANVPFSALYPQVLPYLPGAEPPLVDSQIRKVVREFLKRTTLLRESFVFSTQADAATYMLNPVFGQVSSVLRVGYSGEKHPIPPSVEETRVPVEPAKPTGWYTMLPHLLTFYPQPDGVYPIICDAVITLTQTDVELPGDIVAQYAEALAAGVLATMYGMPGKPWTQSQAAKEAARAYSGAIKTIRGGLRDGGQPNHSTFRGIARFGA